MTSSEALAAGETQAERLSIQAPSVKRAFDVVVGLPLCLLAVPVVVMLAVALAVQHRAWPLFVHARIGHGGRLITIPKLRTLAPHTDPYADKTKVAVEAPNGLDAWILWRTALQTFARRGADLDDIPAWTLRRPELAVADAA